MKILHVSEYCHAGSVGGTERYLLDMIVGLQTRGVESRIGWLSSEKTESFELNGVPIDPLPPALGRVDKPPAELAPAAAALLSAFAPDVVHFHTFGLAEASVASLARQRGIPYFFTYHSPSWMCRREDLLIWGGQKPCDGEVRTLRCAACKVQQRVGGSAFCGYVGALLSVPLDWLFCGSRNADFGRRVCFLSDTRRLRRTLREFLGGCALVISCSEWGMPTLIANSAIPNRVKIIPQGVPRDFVVASSQLTSPPLQRKHEAPFTIGYIGRVSAVKGVEILANGFFQVPGGDLRLKIFGCLEDERSDRNLAMNLSDVARRDSRIELCPALSLSEAVDAYRRLDLVAIPSVGLETGPLVLFEALQMGVPVFGSDRLGHPSLLEQAGTIVRPNTPEGWRLALAGAADEFRGGQWDKRRVELRAKLKLRSMDEVAAEMFECYQPFVRA